MQVPNIGEERRRKEARTRAAVLASLADDDALVEAGARVLRAQQVGEDRWGSLSPRVRAIYMDSLRAILRAIAAHANQETT